MLPRFRPPAPLGLAMGMTLATLVDGSVDEDRHLTAVKLGHTRLNKEETPCEQGVFSLLLSQPCVRPKGFEPLTF